METVGAESAADADIRRASLFWYSALVGGVVVTFPLVAYFGNSSTAQIVLAALWGLIAGGGLLFFIHKNLIITFVGTLLGAAGVGGLEELFKGKGIADVIKAFGKSVRDAADALNSILPGADIHTGPLFLFFLLLLLCCLPAYRE